MQSVAPSARHSWHRFDRGTPTGGPAWGRLSLTRKRWLVRVQSGPGRRQSLLKCLGVQRQNSAVKVQAKALGFQGRENERDGLARKTAGGWLESGPRAGLRGPSFGRSTPRHQRINIKMLGGSPIRGRMMATSAQPLAPEKLPFESTSPQTPGRNPGGRTLPQEKCCPPMAQQSACRGAR